jgi:predicted branched-subunit amino acid permease
LGTRLLAAQFTIDESTAMSAAQDDEVHRRAAFWVTGASVYLFWNVGTLVGALLGKAVDPKVYGLDAAFPAAFVGLLWPMLRERRSAAAAAIGATVCLALVPFTPVGVPILCATLGIVVGVPARAASVAP